MTLQAKGVAELTEADVRALIDNEVQEGKCIDYKRELPGTNDSARKEFLFDVSSFANASGGHLVYGVEEQGGIPKQICGLSVSNTDAELRRLQGIILEGIDPRIPGIDPRFVPVADSKYVFIIHVPKSWNPPHMVTLQRTNKFYTRNSAGKHLLDVSELRSLFAMSSSIAEQVRRFRAERAGRVIADETPVALGTIPRIVLHLLPLQALSSTSRIHLRLAEKELGHLLVPLGAGGYNTRINLDGLLHYTGASFGRSGSESYLQLYHNGIIETVDTGILTANARPSVNTPSVIPSTYLERQLITRTPQYLIALQKLGISPPLVVMITLVGVKGHTMAVPDRLKFGSGGAPIDRDVVLVPEITLEGFDCHPRVLKPMFDSIWNATGWHESPNFDAEGNYRPD